uniref:BPTI/Kunitz inhibitor domain-containing protein n=1 Tax=Hucho hucho TaxID=62062 RepID=A0A4W5Q136_9TELE
ENRFGEEGRGVLSLRYFYDVTASKCSHFWYGGCHGNNNNFLTSAECQRTCPDRPGASSHAHPCCLRPLPRPRAAPPTASRLAR